NSDSPVKFPIFCGLISTDGWMLMGREKVDKFDWGGLRGRKILGFGPGSSPLLYLEARLRKNGPDRQKKSKLCNKTGRPAAAGARRRVARWSGRICHLPRARALAARTRRQGAFHGFGRRNRRICRLRDIHSN